MKPANFPERKAARKRSAANRIIITAGINDPERAYEKQAVVLNYALLRGASRGVRSKKVRAARSSF